MYSDETVIDAVRLQITFFNLPQVEKFSFIPVSSKSEEIFVVFFLPTIR
jgi:hypothetical protein